MNEGCYSRLNAWLNDRLASNQDGAVREAGLLNRYTGLPF